jgi:hypothetical protein
MSVARRLTTTAVIVVPSRRRTPRLSADEGIDVEIVSVLVPADVIDINFGGFSVETRCSLRVGAVHLFRFLTDAGHAIELNAKVIHSRRKAAPDWNERYVTGCEFLHDPNVPTDRLIDALLEYAAGGGKA